MLGLQRAAQRLALAQYSRRSAADSASLPAHAGGRGARRSTAQAAATRSPCSGPRPAAGARRASRAAGWCPVAAADSKDGRNASGGGRGGERRRWRRNLRRFWVHHPSHRRKIGNCAAARRRLPLEPRRDAVVAARRAAAAQTAEPGAILAGVVDLDAAGVPRDLAALAARRPEARPRASLPPSCGRRDVRSPRFAPRPCSSPHAGLPRDAIARSLPLPVPPSVNRRRMPSSRPLSPRVVSSPRASYPLLCPGGGPPPRNFSPTPHRPQR